MVGYFGVWVFDVVAFDNSEWQILPQFAPMYLRDREIGIAFSLA
jgi:hypothetical protein